MTAAAGRRPEELALVRRIRAAAAAAAFETSTNGDDPELVLRLDELESILLDVLVADPFVDQVEP